MFALKPYIGAFRALFGMGQFISGTDGFEGSEQRLSTAGRMVVDLGRATSPATVKTEVLAVVDGQLRAWQLTVEPGRSSWRVKRAAGHPALNLGSMWENNASYYSTIQVGPVAGPGFPTR